eukprot:TRINITY_DN17187_c0_g1_i1.p1 TRINITY_DN17187_c0_g1~~TRINITY_DN17187_c0_g1_i1.p1  ORF type:complete len:764 (+),score=103.43 TRINITY_DN17187_c0_g1_i1:567-2858(+)
MGTPSPGPRRSPRKSKLVAKQSQSTADNSPALLRVLEVNGPLNTPPSRVKSKSVNGSILKRAKPVPSRIASSRVPTSRPDPKSNSRKATSKRTLPDVSTQPSPAMIVAKKRKRTEVSTESVSKLKTASKPRARSANGTANGSKASASKRRESLDSAVPVTVDDLSGADDSMKHSRAVKRTRELYEAFYSSEVDKKEKPDAAEKELANECSLDKPSSKRKAVKKSATKITKKGQKAADRGAEAIMKQKEHLKNTTDRVKKPSFRPDLKSLKKMKEENLMLCGTKAVVGRIRGILPGARFFSRCELCVVGLHAHWLHGIDYIPESRSTYGTSVATSVIASGGYADDEDNQEELIYTGSGGNDLLGNKAQYEDQKMEKGNLALKNSIEVKNPVRVIRGHRTTKTGTGAKQFTYDGLYQVVSFEEKTGEKGFLVYKFKLRRMDNQPALTSDQVKFISGKGVPRSIKDCPGVKCKDISGGKEKIPIVVTNVIDTDPTKFLPPQFEYITDFQWSKKKSCPARLRGCNCKEGSMCNETKCACAGPKKEFAYAGRKLTWSKALVVECGPNCGCSSLCPNRVAQNGIRFRLEVFKTVSKGWAVRSWDFIPRGSVVVAYTGKVLHQSDLTWEDMYVLNLDTVECAAHGTSQREAKSEEIKAHIRQLRGEEGAAAPEQKKRSKTEWVIDAKEAGNVSRFINHSCDPNLFYQATLWDHGDPQFAHPVLVAQENIPAMTELTYDYAYKIGSVRDQYGAVKSCPCNCGEKICRQRLY